jgi:two-component system cell cycle response regulator DivK
LNRLGNGRLQRDLVRNALEYDSMAGEPILVVDDTLVNLKLTRILLANEGYKVQTAASAEEALELLRGYHPLLILADIQLPGMDGLEMTRRLKSDAQTRDITVVALTAFAMKGDEQKARDAGCDGYITKPIDTRTLGKRVREYLDRPKVPASGVPAPMAAAAAPGGDSVTAGKMNAVRRLFLAEGEEGAQGLLRDLDGPFNASEATRVVHQWVGTGGLLGYNDIGRIAQDVEGLLAQRPIDAAEVRQSLTNLAFAFTAHREAFDLPVPQTFLDTLSGKRVAIVGMPVNDAHRLAAALERASAKPVLYEAANVSDGRKMEDCDLVVIYLQPGAPREWRNPVAGMAARRPMVLAGRREDLMALDQTAQSQAIDILMDSWQAEEALARLSLAISHPRPPAAGSAQHPTAPRGRLQVLIAGDDPTVLALARTAFENFGVDYQTASDGAAAVEAVRRFEPDAMVLDAAIGGLDGYQMLSAMGAEKLPVPVLLLAARQQESDIVRGLALGAGDFLFKPFSPLELVARLKRLTGR